MGILDSILGMFQTSKPKNTRAADSAVKKAQQVAQSGSYNQASIHAFYALEQIGEQYGEQKRESHITAREYAEQMSESGLTTTEELEPIILNFEIAKYSEGEVSSEDYGRAEQALTVVHKKYKTGRPVKSKATAKKGTVRRKPTRGGTTGAARKRTTGSSRSRSSQGTPRKKQVRRK